MTPFMSTLFLIILKHLIPPLAVQTQKETIVLLLLFKTMLSYYVRLQDAFSMTTNPFTKVIKLLYKNNLTDKRQILNNPTLDTPTPP
jgi:hypothetical protein